MKSASRQTLSFTRTVTVASAEASPPPSDLDRRNNEPLGPRVSADAVRLTAVKVGTLDD